MAHTFNPNTRKAEEADPCELVASLVYRGMPRLRSETPCLNKQIITDFQRGAQVLKPWQLWNRAIIMKFVEMTLNPQSFLFFHLCLLALLFCWLQGRNGAQGFTLLGWCLTIELSSGGF